MQEQLDKEVQDKTWVSDPDGNRLEVSVVLEDNLAVSNACCTNVPASLQSISRA